MQFGVARMQIRTQTITPLKTFKVSLYYLFGHFGALMIEALLRNYGLSHHGRAGSMAMKVEHEIHSHKGRNMGVSLLLLGDHRIRADGREGSRPDGFASWKV
jgi:hypothetical protein